MKAYRNVARIHVTETEAGSTGQSCRRMRIRHSLSMMVPCLMVGKSMQTLKVARCII